MRLAYLLLACSFSILLFVTAGDLRAQAPSPPAQRPAGPPVTPQADTVPPSVARFTGTVVSQADRPAALGLLLEAYIGQFTETTLCARSEIVEEGRYTIDVAAAETNLGCGTEGATIFFWLTTGNRGEIGSHPRAIAGLPLTPPGVFHADTTIELDLRVIPLSRPPTPAPRP